MYGSLRCLVQGSDLRPQPNETETTAPTRSKEWDPAPEAENLVVPLLRGARVVGYLFWRGLGGLGSSGLHRAYARVYYLFYRRRRVYIYIYISLSLSLSSSLSLSLSLSLSISLSLSLSLFICACRPQTFFLNP